MASTSEKGHAKNIANANLLNTFIMQLGSSYNPSNPQLTLANLQTLYATTLNHQDDVTNLVAPYALAIDNRESIFNPISKKVTKLRKVYKATEGVTAAQVESFMTIARKLKGLRKVNSTPTTDATEEQNQHSVSQMSFDQRTSNYGALIAFLQSTPNYNPNEAEYQIATLEVEKTQMATATQNVANIFVPLNNARSIRNSSMYLSNENLVDTCNKAKDYIFTILDSNSVQYKAISKIKFKKA